MATQHPNYTDADITALLQGHGIKPTAQRSHIARLLFERCMHLSAEDVYRLVNPDVGTAPGSNGQRVSMATVYNTLGLFASKGLVREVIADPNKVFYDPNTAPHYHFYDAVAGTLTDIDADEVEVVGLPKLPSGMALDGVDVIVRLRPEAEKP